MFSYGGNMKATVRFWALFAAVMLFDGGIGVLRAEEADPLKLLKRMTDHVGSQQHIAATVDTDIEVITPELQKLQFASSSTLQLSRPDKLRVARRGGYADVELIFDGKVLTIFGKNINAYAQVPLEGTTDQLLQRLHTDFDVGAPGADLLATNAYALLTDDIVDAKYIGHGVIGGVDCDHIAIRDHDTDWQIWIERGANPIPRKYVITSKAVTGGPQYTLLVRDWKEGEVLGADDLKFSPPADAKKAEPKDLVNLDEVPAATVQGAVQ
jgi:hypothetical protein